MTSGGDGTLGYKHTLETKVKMSKGHADVSGIKNPRYGKPISEETRIKLSLAAKKQFAAKSHPWLGRKHTEESNMKNRLAHLGRKRSYSSDSPSSSSSSNIGVIEE